MTIIIMQRRNFNGVILGASLILLISSLLINAQSKSISKESLQKHLSRFLDETSSNVSHDRYTSLPFNGEYESYDNSLLRRMLNSTNTTSTNTTSSNTTSANSTKTNSSSASDNSSSSGNSSKNSSSNSSNGKNQTNQTVTNTTSNSSTTNQSYSYYNSYYNVSYNSSYLSYLSSYYNFSSNYSGSELTVSDFLSEWGSNFTYLNSTFSISDYYSLSQYVYNYNYMYYYIYGSYYYDYDYDYSYYSYYSYYGSNYSSSSYSSSYNSNYYYNSYYGSSYYYYYSNTYSAYLNYTDSSYSTARATFYFEIIAVPIIFSIVAASTITIVFARCVKRTVINGRPRWSCRKATLKGKCFHKKTHKQLHTTDVDNTAMHSRTLSTISILPALSTKSPTPDLFYSTNQSRNEDFSMTDKSPTSAIKLRDDKDFKGEDIFEKTDNSLGPTLQDVAITRENTQQHFNAKIVISKDDQPKVVNQGKTTQGQQYTSWIEASNDNKDDLKSKTESDKSNEQSKNKESQKGSTQQTSNNQQQSKLVEPVKLQKKKLNP